MGQTKVVLDTNILISALGWNGKPREVFERCIDRAFELATSQEQLAELRRVLDYPKFNFTKDEKEVFISLILKIATIVDILGTLDVIREDPDDNVILETAMTGKCEYLISGDPHLLQLKKVDQIEILTAHEFLEKVR